MIILVGSYDFKDSSWNIQLQEYSQHQKLVAMYSSVRDSYVVEELARQLLYTKSGPSYQFSGMMYRPQEW